jgi:hypothetical protein
MNVLFIGYGAPCRGGQTPAASAIQRKLDRVRPGNWWFNAKFSKLTTITIGMPYGQFMNQWVAAGWGLAGGLCVEALLLYSRIRSDLLWSWRRPIPQGLAAYLISVVARVAVGAGLAAAAAGSGQVSGPLAAFGLGVGAPLVVEKLARAVYLAGPSPATDDNQTSSTEGSKDLPVRNPDGLIPGKSNQGTKLDSVEAETTGVSDAS